jgi:cell division initiation protein
MSQDHEPSSQESAGPSPLAVRKTEFGTRLRGYDPEQVEEFRELVAEELARVLGLADRLRQENRRLEERLEDSRSREKELQETLLRAQKVSDEIMATSHREAQLLVKEAEMTADRIVRQAIEQAQEVEGRIDELRARRHELQLKLRSTLELYTRILDEDQGEEAPRATIHRLSRDRPTE